MRPPQFSDLLATLALLLPSATASTSPPAHTLALSLWPLSAPSPTPFTTVAYTLPSTDASSSLPPSSLAEVKSFNAPSGSDDDALVRLGYADPKTGRWHGVLTGADSFAGLSASSGGKIRTVIEVVVDERGEVVGVGMGAPEVKVGEEMDAKGKGGKRKREADKKSKKKGGKQEAETTEGGKEQTPIEVRVVRVADGPKPVLNRPVVVRPDGKVEGKEEEKTFLQKYWWMIAIFIVLQIVIGGGGEK
ncbi:hypothetical protein BDY21DRAFT_343079 [Lineolata rhizophorae]|uniref:ER membrane protein complex subunit 10 n=1 Tax=Lineolata rhizophorae TaxID=578093 RepID=A0A6A6P1H8_9PEZI|nr:hypothetical protein BDY21DRAFT_343079 [Lineolata rhizophorae]